MEPETKQKTGPKFTERLEEVKGMAIKFQGYISRLEERVASLEKQIPARMDEVVPVSPIPNDMTFSSFETRTMPDMDSAERAVAAQNADVYERTRQPEIARHLAQVARANDELMAILLAFVGEHITGGALNISHPPNTHDVEGVPLIVRWDELITFINALVKGGKVTPTKCRIMVYELLRCRALIVEEGEIKVNPNMHRALMV